MAWPEARVTKWMGTLSLNHASTERDLDTTSKDLMDVVEDKKFKVRKQ